MRIDRQDLESFCSEVFASLSLPRAEAEIAARVLVAADAMGIPSHGLARLPRYVEGLKTGLMAAQAVPQTLAETQTSLVIDAHGAMGAPVSERTMRAVIAKASSSGAAFACVRDSNHFGIAGFYARLALEHDMLGIAMTNTAALGVPTFGSQVMFGTNPIAFAAPAGKEEPFVLDMSTTVVPRGRLEVYSRLEKALPEGWAVDKRGHSTSEAAALLADMQERVGGGILPLGGLGKDFGGHKGYGLAIMVDVLCALLCGAAFGPAVMDTATSSARVSHFFGAIRISSFRDIAAFRADMDEMLRSLRSSPPAEGEERVSYAGLSEAEAERESASLGVPLISMTWESLVAVGRELAVQAPGPV